MDTTKEVIKCSKIWSIWDIATVIMHTVTLTLLLTAVSSDYWVLLHHQDGVHLINTGKVLRLNGEYQRHHGLWRLCDNNVNNCSHLNEFYLHAHTKWFLAAQVSAVSACVFVFIAFVSALFKLCLYDGSSVVATINMFIAWICITITLSIVTDKENTNYERHIIERHWGWSYIIGWISASFALIASVVAWFSVAQVIDEDWDGKLDVV